MVWIDWVSISDRSLDLFIRALYLARCEDPAFMYTLGCKFSTGDANRKAVTFFRNEVANLHQSLYLGAGPNPT